MRAELWKIKRTYFKSRPYLALINHAGMLKNHLVIIIECTKLCMIFNRGHSWMTIDKLDLVIGGRSWSLFLLKIFHTGKKVRIVISKNNPMIWFICLRSKMNQLKKNQRTYRICKLCQTRLPAKNSISQKCL